ncbi:type IV pilus twitching motility protein PilT [bacterium]|nr:type IV pilus twitching motility protein PilT [bacterium]
MDQTISKFVNNEGLSDIHIQSGSAISLRINGIIEKQNTELVSVENVLSFLKKNLSKDQFDEFNNKKNLDFALELNKNRFRANAYLGYNGCNIVLRKIETKIPDINDLNLPPVVNQQINSDNGLILITGPTGSGKSTSLASIINYINMNKQKNIITIEDPIEFIHKADQSIISQREIGIHATSFANALRASLREDPDVILVGELRDLETTSLALTAAETGHLVLGTLHTSGAPNTIHRIIDMFPSEQQDQIRSQLASSLKLVMTQKLIRKIDGSGRLGAFEVMVCNAAIKNLIRENKIHQVPTVMQTGLKDGMITMDKSIENLINDGLINFDDTQ